jgi:hypothetical protein
MRVPICMLILCVMVPSLLLPCSAKRRGVGARKQGCGGRIWGWNVRFKANVGCVERKGAPLTHPEAAGGFRVREGERVGSTKAVMGQVLGGGKV